MAEVILQDVVLHVLNVWNTFEWYQVVFGAELVSAAPDGSRLEWRAGSKSVVCVADGAARLDFWNAQVNSFLSEPAGFHLVLVTTDVQIIFDRALAHGAAVLIAPTTTPNGRMKAALRDLNGIGIKLVEAFGD